VRRDLIFEERVGDLENTDEMPMRQHLRLLSLKTPAESLTDFTDHTDFSSSDPCLLCNP
jgi:hypothetical protein